MDDYVGYLKAPVGTWDGKTYRISIDGDCHNFNYRTDYFQRRSSPRPGRTMATTGDWAVPDRPGSRCRRHRSSSRAKGSPAVARATAISIR